MAETESKTGATDSDGSSDGAPESAPEAEEQAATERATEGEEEKAPSKARLPLALGAAAITAVAGGIAVAGRRARKTVLGVKLPRLRSRSPADVLSDGVEEVGKAGKKVGDKVGDLPGVERLRDKARRE